MATRNATVAKPARAKTGRPSKFREEFIDQARRLCLLGLTNEELARAFDVGITTIDRWIHDNEEFRGAIQRGRQGADSMVADRLYQRALGYEHDDVDIRVVAGRIVKTKLRKFYPPDTAAAFIWLKNRQPSRWRDKQPEGSDLTPEQIAALAQAAIAAANANEHPAEDAGAGPPDQAQAAP